MAARANGAHVPMSIHSSVRPCDVRFRLRTEWRFVRSRCHLPGCAVWGSQKCKFGSLASDQSTCVCPRAASQSSRSRPRGQHHGCHRRIFLRVQACRDRSCHRRSCLDCSCELCKAMITRKPTQGSIQCGRLQETPRASFTKTTYNKESRTWQMRRCASLYQPDGAHLRR